MLLRILRIGQLTGFELLLLVDLHQIGTFLIEFILIALVVYRLSRSSKSPPKTYALLSIMAVGVFAANIPSFLLFLTLGFNCNLFYLIIPVSIAIEYIFLLLMFLLLRILPDDRRFFSALALFIAVTVGNLLSYGVFWVLTILL
jgi:hypothetical protein